MTPLHPLFDDLLSADSWTRRAAVGRSDLSQPALRYALRRILYRDGDAHVRAAAALRLSRTKAQNATGSVASLPAPVEVAAWLHDALNDVAPLVREAALRGLARLAPRLPILARAEHAKSTASLASGDATWWVRRAALLAHAALLSLQAERSVPLLRARLADPFWRVRHAAAQALYAIGLRQPELREAILAPDQELPGTGQAALWYLRARFQPAIDIHTFPSLPPDGPLHNADPAVVTARLRAQADNETTPQDLIAFFADPHEPLRLLAVERLRRVMAQASVDASFDRQAQAVLRALLPWLETPTLPHAAETTVAFLDSLGEPAARLCREILRSADPRVGALRWATEYAAQTQAYDLVPWLLRQCEHRDAAARAAVLGALLVLQPEHAATGGGRPNDTQLAWVRGLADEHIDVRSLAAAGLVQSVSDPALHDLLWQRPLSDFRPAARLQVIDLARRCGRRDVLQRALGDAHPLVRAAALRALLRPRSSSSPAHTSLAPEGSRDALGWLADRDPELRRAALLACPEQWLTLLAHDPDPEVRRATLRAVASQAGRQCLGPDGVRQAARVASTVNDPWLRTEGAALLASNASEDADLVTLLGLSRDSEESVRAAAADGLGDASVAPRLRRLLHGSPHTDTRAAGVALSPEGRAAAYAWIALHEGEAATDLLLAAGCDPDEPAAVRAILPSLRFLAQGGQGELGELPSDAPDLSTPTRDAAVPPGGVSTIIRRPLGRTGITVAPLGLSGAYDPPLSALHQARGAGVNLFFWEPSYLRLTRFLRRHNTGSPAARSGVVIVAGSFEADRVGIERDVARALRRLRTSYLDVLLLLWVRSPERLSQEALDCLRDLKRRGTIRAFGFSTHHRELAASVVPTGDWDVVMLRHSAAHPGAEDRLLPLCAKHGVGVITFSALSYGRLLRAQPAETSEASSDDSRHENPEVLGPLPTAAECYRYTLSQPGVAACWSAPRSYGELLENLSVLHNPQLAEDDCERLRRHGRLVRAEDRRFFALLRHGHDGSPETLAKLTPPADPLAAALPPIPMMPPLDVFPASATFADTDRDPREPQPDRQGDADALSDLLNLLEAQAPGEDPAVSLAEEGNEPTGPSGASSTSFALALGQSFLSRRRKSEKM